MSSDQPIEPAPPTPAAPPVAGWYPDPADATMQRYWDGNGWTATTHPLVAAQPPVDAQPPVAAQPPSWPAAAPGAPVYGTPGYGSVPAGSVPPGAQYPAGAVTGYPAVAPGYGVQHRQVGFREAIGRAFAGWKDYSGRSTVAEYWWFYLFQMLVLLVPYAVFLVLLFATVPELSTSSTSGSTPEPLSGGLVAAFVIFGLLYLLLGIVFFVVTLPLTIRRLHDTDREGLWFLISFVPFGSIVLLVMTVMPGTPGPNRYGPVPT